VTEGRPDTIHTERLILRPWRRADLHILHDALVESVDHLSPWIPWAQPETPTVADAEARLGIWIRDFDTGTNHVYAVFEERDGRLIGGVGLHPRVGPGAIEVGYWIRLRDVGRGLATEATRALTDVAFRLPDIDRVEIHCAPANAPSRRVAEKAGYRFTGIGPHHDGSGGEPVHLAIYALTKDEYGTASAAS
jgi:RimJ/RimL family protein N-acetyltransferase